MIAKGTPLMISPAAVTTASAASAYQAAQNDASVPLGGGPGQLQLVTNGLDPSDTWFREAVAEYTIKIGANEPFTAFKVGSRYFLTSDNSPVVDDLSGATVTPTGNTAFMLVVFNESDVQQLATVGASLQGYVDPDRFLMDGTYQGLRASSWASIGAGARPNVTFGV